MLKTPLKSATLLPENDGKCAPVIGNSPVAVQQKRSVETGKNADIPAEPRNVLDRLPAYPGEEETVSIAEAARTLGIEPKRLLGFCMRNGVGDPISDGRYVYPSSIKVLAERLAAIKSGAI